MDRTSTSSTSSLILSLLLRLFSLLGDLDRLLRLRSLDLDLLLSKVSLSLIFSRSLSLTFRPRSSLSRSNLYLSLSRSLSSRPECLMFTSGPPRLVPPSPPPKQERYQNFSFSCTYDCMVHSGIPTQNCYKLLHHKWIYKNTDAYPIVLVTIL